jgi:hypothetical protein
MPATREVNVYALTGRRLVNFPLSRLWTQQYWAAGRVVLQLSAAAAMMTHNEGITLLISGIAMMAETAQDRSTHSR